MFIFEGNAAVLNVRAECKNIQQYPRILTSSITVVITLFMIFATFSYYIYKETCNPIFVLTLQPITPIVTAIYILVCINAYCSYPVQILCAFDIAE